MLPVLGAAVLAGARSPPRAAANAPAPRRRSEPAPVAVRVAAVQSQPIDRFLRVTGSLSADERADVAAEIAGRVDRHAGRARHARRRRRGAGAPVRRPKRTRRCARRKPTRRSSKRGSASPPDRPFDPARVPDVLNAKASLDWAEADFARIKSLLDQKVVSQAEYDQR